MSEARPIASFVIAAHNAEAFIEDAVRSVLRQTMLEVEAIVVDDGSTDDTVTRLAGLRSDPRLRVVSQPNRGCAVARNHGIELATGRYVAILDADDLCWPERAEVQVRALRERSDVAVVGGRARFVSTSNRHLGVIRPPVDYDAIRTMMQTKMAFVGASIMMSAETWRAFGGYDVSYPTSEDYELLSRVVQNRRAMNLTEILLDVRIHPMSKSFYMLEQQQLRCLFVRQVVSRGGWGGCPGHWREAAGGPLTPAILEEVGVPPSRIHDTLSSTYKERISTSIRLGQWESARALLDRALRYAENRDESFVAELSVLSAMNHAGQGALGAAAGNLVDGLVREPRAVGRLVGWELKKRAHTWKTWIESGVARRRRKEGPA